MSYWPKATWRDYVALAVLVVILGYGVGRIIEFLVEHVSITFSWK